VRIEPRRRLGTLLLILCHSFLGTEAQIEFQGHRFEIPLLL